MSMSEYRAVEHNIAGLGGCSGVKNSGQIGDSGGVEDL